MKVTESNYIHLLKQRNEKALLYIVDEYSGLLKSVIAKTMPGMPDHQEECLNDVLMAIWDHIDSFQPEKNSFKNWIAAIAKYKAIDFLRRYSRQLTEVPLEHIKSEQITNPDLLENEISEQTEELLSCLSPTDKELFIRLYIKDESMDHVSKAVDLSKPVIYNRLSRAKKKLRKKGRSS